MIIELDYLHLAGTTQVLMEFKPRYPQPFTIAQAVEFDVSLITEGLASVP